jgi:selenocysteine lyase/cysteine desulfurase
VELLQQFGMQNVAQQVRILTEALITGASNLGVHLKTPPDSVGPLVVLQAKDAGGLVRLFAEQGLVCSSRHDGLRISFHAYNSLDDVKFVLRLIEENLAGFVTSAEATRSANRL